jgi:hypothetical protein
VFDMNRRVGWLKALERERRIAMKGDVDDAAI